MSFNAIPLLLLLVLAACAPHPEQPDSATAPMIDSLAVEPQATEATPRGETSGESIENPAQMADVDPPTIATVRMQDGVLATLTFRTAAGVSVSDSQPLLFVVDGETFEAPLDAGPARFTEPSGTVVDQASYTLTSEAYGALLQTSADAVTVRIDDGDGYRDFPYVSSDFIE